MRRSLPWTNPPNLQKLAEAKNFDGLAEVALQDPQEQRRLEAFGLLRGLSKSAARRAAFDIAAREGDGPLVDAALDLLREDQNLALAEIRGLLNSQGGPRRLDAVTVLSRLGGRSAAQRLATALGDPDDGLVFAVIGALEGIADESSLDPLGALVRDSNKPARAVRAAQALAVIRSPNSVADLIIGLGRDEAPIRRACAQALGKFATPAAAEALARRITDPDAGIRQEIEAALRLCGGAAQAPLSEVLHQQPMRKPAVDLLDKLGLRPNTRRSTGIYAVMKQDWDLCVRVGVDALGALGEHIETRNHELLINIVRTIGRIAERTADKTIFTPYLPHIIRLLDSAEFRMREVGAYALRAIGDTRATEKLFEIAAAHADSDDGKAAAEALRSHDETVSQALLAKLGDHEPRVVSVAGEILRGRPDFIAAVSRGMLGGAEPTLRARCVRLAAQGDSDRLVAPLLQALANDAEESVRGEAFRALGRLARHLKAGDVDRIPTHRMTLGLMDQQKETSDFARRLILQTSRQQAIDHLIEYFREGFSGETRALSESVLVQLGARAVGQLLDALDRPETTVQEWCARCLAQIGDPRALDRFHALLRHDSAPVRRWAAGGLKKLGDPASVTPLAAACADAEPEVREEVLRALGGIVPTLNGAGGAAYQRAIDVVTEAFHDPAARVRAAAVQAAGQIGDPCAEDPLIEVLESPARPENGALRELAAVSLGQVRSRKSAPALIHALRDPIYPVRRKAAEAIDAVGWDDFTREDRLYYWAAKGDVRACIAEGPLAIDALLSIFDGDDEALCIEACAALAEIDHVKVVEALTGLLKKPSFALFLAAARALESMGRRSYLGPLVDRVEDPTFREQAVPALVERMMRALGKPLCARLLERAHVDNELTLRRGALEALVWLKGKGLLDSDTEKFLAPYRDEILRRRIGVRE